MTNGLFWANIGVCPELAQCAGELSMNTTVLGKSPHLLFALAVLSCLYGCQGPSAGMAGDEEAIKPSEKLVVDPDGRVADVPVPLGARFKAGSSRSYETGSLRRVDYNYGVWAKKSLIRRFYQDNMPMHGWKLINSIRGEHRYSMNYKKGQESCRVNIGPTNWCFQTLIEIIIEPVSDFD